ncbi:MAG: MBL fold metallo-hydrolase [Deltaproteobacteria bacterium TMED126]|nr:MBL fold metallo-hydrolase [Candidatus Dadabacteria bacterium]NSW98014.1 MBL fold metallo-hydrolase [Deltaproteobacteria bacterium TMED126]|tara:strand:+ start:3485 stop:4291 length:807 start_codon:yes stop_codon:yes gene_type:complete
MYHQISAETFNIYRFLVPNSDRNIGYVLECKNTKKCLIFDPLDKDIIDKILDDNDLKPEYILNTHAHPDHIKYNSYYLEKFKVKLLAHDMCKDLFDHEFDNIFENDVIKIGDLKLKVLHTPGHCPEHISIIADNYLFCGDTIFNCGVGNVHFRGNITMLFRTIHHKIKHLSNELIILPGHDYLQNNLSFLGNLISDSDPIIEELKTIESQCLDNDLSPLKTISFEKKYNPFFRIDELSFLDILSDPKVFETLTMEDRFIKLRSLRDKW